MTADSSTAMASSTGKASLPTMSSTATDPQQMTPVVAFTMISVLRSWRSANVPPNTAVTCCAIAASEPNQPAAVVDPVSLYPIRETARYRRATPMAVALSAVNHGR